MTHSLFKYFKSEKNAKKMITEWKILIGTLSYYRNIEDETKADRNEGKKSIVTTFPKEEIIKSTEEFDSKLGFLKDSNIHYVKGTIKVEADTNFIGDDDIPDAYIYCTSKTYSKKLKEKWGNYCVEIFDVERFLHIISMELFNLWLIYDPSMVPVSGMVIKYIWHEIKDENKISGNWIKDIKYRDEAEFRLTFVPIIKKDGAIIPPIIDENKSATFAKNHDKLVLYKQIIQCKEITTCCRKMF